jgi:hypothetical protein
MGKCKGKGKGLGKGKGRGKGQGSGSGSGVRVRVRVRVRLGVISSAPYIPAVIMHLRIAVLSANSSDPLDPLQRNPLRSSSCNSCF